jgi:hypothetical protein
MSGKGLAVVAAAAVNRSHMSWSCRLLIYLLLLVLLLLVVMVVKGLPGVWEVRKYVKVRGTVTAMSIHTMVPHSSSSSSSSRRRGRRRRRTSSMHVRFAVPALHVSLRGTLVCKFPTLIMAIPTDR